MAFESTADPTGRRQQRISEATMPLNAPSNYLPRAFRAADNDYAEIKILIERTAARDISRLARSTDFSFDALAAFGMAYLARNGRRMLRREARRSAKFLAHHLTPASHE